MDGLDSIFKPESIAVIGASDTEGTLNRALFMNLIMGNFKGPVFPVNPRHRFIHGIRAYRTIDEIPDPVELAVILVPRDYVMSVVDGCGKKGVKGLIVVTAGYKEIGGEGIKLETELVKLVRSYGMRMVGPNCFGVMNTDPEVQMNATFTAYDPTPGKVGFISQSGGLGEILIDRAERESLGMAQFASVGNKADIHGNELLEYWDDNKKIKAILMYLENIGNPREFGELAKYISRVKPIITLKAGRTARGAAAASSHTGALADEDAANQAIFEQYGVIQVNSVETLFQVGSLIVNQPPPRGRNVAVITNAGGPGILATDALVQQGLNVPDISDEGKTYLRKILREECSLRNPIDLIASGGGREYKAAIDVALNQKDIDSIMVLFIPVIMIDSMEVAEVIVQASNQQKKPIQVVWLTRGKIHGQEAEALLRKYDVPLYEMPLDAAKALGLVVNYFEWRSRPLGEEKKFKTEKKIHREIISNALAQNRLALHDSECMDILNNYGLPTLPTVRASSKEETIKAAEKFGYPVVLKASREGLIHKTEVGGVELNIETLDDLEKAYDRIMANLKKINLLEGANVLVQPMITTGEENRGAVECVLGLKRFKKYGPMIMFGLGGIFIEILKAVEFRMAPLTDEEARHLITDSPGWPVLKGARGRPPVDIESIVDSILRLSQLAVENPEISEIDLNPFFVFPDGKKNLALDQVILLEKPE